MQKDGGSSTGFNAPSGSRLLMATTFFPKLWSLMDTRGGIVEAGKDLSGGELTMVVILKSRPGQGSSPRRVDVWRGVG